MSRKQLNLILGALHDLAPLHLAEDWDNVGLLLEPDKQASTKNVLLTIDLTEAVLAEAIQKKCGLIVSYHPPIFSGMKRLGQSKPQDRVILACARRGISIYSPHTALDAASGGVNDWLAHGLGLKNPEPIQRQQGNSFGHDLKVVVFVPKTHVEQVRQALSECGCGTIGHYYSCSFESSGEGTFFGDSTTNPQAGSRNRLERVPEIRLEMVGNKKQLAAMDAAIRATHPYEEVAWDAYALEPLEKPGVGQGRIGQFLNPISVSTAIKRTKSHLGLARVRVAIAPKHQTGKTLLSLAVCAGAGASVILGTKADLLLTGEMRHHDILAANSQGQTVILCDHTNTERGYLAVFAQGLIERVPGTNFLLSSVDRDPLDIV